MKLTTEQKLAYHLAHGVKMAANYRHRRNPNVRALNHEDFDELVYTFKRKPLLRPLSSLTKPITVEGYNEGKSFVPIDEIGKIMFGREYRSFENKPGCKIAFITSKGKAFKGFSNVEKLEFWIINLLLSWQFNVLGFEEGEYVQIADDNNS